ncbi:hypothetical protein PVMG_04203 [Plasmodium vivax Mauritania I]|nr:hypothetical protein PVMG_04203 [Plasmodium vivax Mauritania I]
MKCVALILVCISFHLQQGVGPFRVKRRGVSACPSFVLHPRRASGGIIQRANKSQNSRAFLWGYPIYDDSPFKLRRPKIYPNFEYGELRKSQDFDYVISTNIAQKNYKIPDVGYLYNVEEMGTGRTDDVHTPIEMVFGERDVDPKEVEKIKAVLNTFDQGNGMGICTLMGAKRAHFAFKYNGYLSHFHGVKSYLR